MFKLDVPHATQCAFESEEAVTELHSADAAVESEVCVASIEVCYFRV